MSCTRNASIVHVVDTNVLVYAFDAGEREKQASARLLLDHLSQAELGVLTVQVLGEFFASTTRTLTPMLLTGMRGEPACYMPLNMPATASITRAWR